MSDGLGNLRGNPAYQACIAELDRLRIPHTVEFGGKHPKIVFDFRGKEYRRPIAGTPGDTVHGPRNAVADIRRILHAAERQNQEVGKGNQSMTGVVRLLPLDFDGRRVRLADRDGETWFVAADVCGALELKGDPGQHTRRLDADEKGLISNQTLGGQQQISIISEPGVYRLVFASRKDAAEKFKRWLAHEVIPAIRKTGAYDPPKAGDDDVLRRVDGIVRMLAHKVTSIEKNIDDMRAAEELQMDASAVSREVAELITAYEVIVGPCEVPPGKAFRGLAGQVSARLNLFCATHSIPIGIVYTRPGHKYGYRRPAALKWLAEGGRAYIWRMIKEHADRKGGQRSLQLVG